jgi:hypothetical protein
MRAKLACGPPAANKITSLSRSPGGGRKGEVGR